MLKEIEMCFTPYALSMVCISQTELEKKRSEANEMEAQHKLVCKSLDQMKIAVAELFSKMKCDPSPITGKLGSSAEVTDDNVTQFIGTPVWSAVHQQ